MPPKKSSAEDGGGASVELMNWLRPNAESGADASLEPRETAERKLAAAAQLLEAIYGKKMVSHSPTPTAPLAARCCTAPAGCGVTDWAWR